MINSKYTDNESLKKAHLDFPDNMPLGYEHYTMLYSKLFEILLEIPQKSYVLDMGCNSGEISRLLNDFRDCKTQGIDISEKVVKITQSKGFRAIVGDNEHLPFEDNTFDCVFMGEMIEHSHKPQNILKEAYRVLKPGGKLLGTTAFEEICIAWDDNRLHAKTYNPDTMKELINKVFYNTKVWLNEYPQMTTIMFVGYKKYEKRNT